VEFGADGEAFPDRIADIRLSLGLCSPLADATRNGRAIGDVCAVFVLTDAHNELHNLLDGNILIVHKLADLGVLL
jgi:hypothetical protein